VEADRGRVRKGEGEVGRQKWNEKSGPSWRVGVRGQRFEENLLPGGQVNELGVYYMKGPRGTKSENNKASSSTREKWKWGQKEKKTPQPLNLPVNVNGEMQTFKLALSQQGQTSKSEAVS